MNDLIIALIDKIEDEALRGAVIRAYNNARSLVISGATTLVESAGLYFINNGIPETFSELFDKAKWEYIFVVFIAQHLFVASYEKAIRKSKELEG